LSFPRRYGKKAYFWNTSAAGLTVSMVALALLRVGEWCQKNNNLSLMHWLICSICNLISLFVMERRSIIMKRMTMNITMAKKNGCEDRLWYVDR